MSALSATDDPTPPFEPDCPLARAAPSPNHGERRGEGFAAHGVDSLILHYTGMKTADAALDRLRDPAAEVSSHYLVYEDGRIFQLVPEARRAWHAGAAFWRGERDLNSRSIGVEIANPGHDGGAPPFMPAQMAAVRALVADICARREIAPERVLAHSDIAPGRKLDPGEAFPWEQLEAAGLARPTPNAPARPGLWLGPGARGAAVTELRARLARLGFEMAPGEIYDEAARVRIEAFQRRYRRARVDGLADPQTRDLLAALTAPRPTGTPPDRS